VEDEVLVALPLEAELVDAGFHVVVAHSGSQGILELEDDPDRFAGLITDIRLPGVEGWGIAKRARELVPTMPVVYMSGDSAAEWPALGVPNSIMLSKPFASAQLIAAVTMLFDTTPHAGRQAE
jgi:DNA-binding response OmpR family regulator